MTHIRGKKPLSEKEVVALRKLVEGKRTTRTASQSGRGFDASCFRPFESEGFRYSERNGFSQKGS